MVIPNCKKISNEQLCGLLTQNPSLLTLDILNKLTPTINLTVLNTVVRSCRYLTVLKLSDYRVEDPKTLLLLCGRVVSTPPDNSQGVQAHQDSAAMDSSREEEDSLSSEKCLVDELANKMNNLLIATELDSDRREGACGEAGADVMNDITGFRHLQHCNVNHDFSSASSSFNNNTESRDMVAVTKEELVLLERDVGHSLTQEEEENHQRVRPPSSQSGSSEKSNDHKGDDDDDEDDDDDDGDGGEEAEEDLYEDDSVVCPLEVEDHSSEFGCMELETLWLDNINLTDQVAAILLQSLTHLRDINFSDTDICNPWRLLDSSKSSHLRYLQDLDVKSTALSRTALQMIPDYHPDLQKLSISSTTLPPPTYATITRLTGIAELELIGGQFYPSEPEDIFTRGILPAVGGVGKHLQSLNLTYFAHVNFRDIVLNCPKICHLDLSYTNIFTVCPCPALGEHCPNLLSLNLGYAHIQANTASLQIVPADKAFQQMVGELSAIQDLRLCGLAVNDEGIRTMFPGQEYPLRVLDISHCKKVTIHGIQHLWKRCPYLTNIDISHCTDITHVDYKKFEEECRKNRPVFQLEGTIKWK